MQFMELIWIAMIVVFGILEAVTVQFVCIWFAGGALCSFIAALCGADTTWQSIIFVFASALFLIFTRPIVRKLTKNVGEPTNADSLIGKNAVVTKAPDAFGDGGQAKIAGNFWSFTSADHLEKDDVVTVEKIEGVKLVVKKQEKAPENISDFSDLC